VPDWRVGKGTQNRQPVRTWYRPCICSTHTELHRNAPPTYTATNLRLWRSTRRQPSRSRHSSTSVVCRASSWRSLTLLYVCTTVYRLRPVQYTCTLRLDCMQQVRRSKLCILPIRNRHSAYALPDWRNIPPTFINLRSDCDILSSIWRCTRASAMLIICHLPVDERLITASLHMMSWMLDTRLPHAAC
jgi:hypothetical protein